MTGDTSALVIQFVFLLLLFSLLGFIGGVRVRFVALGPKGTSHQDTRQSVTDRDRKSGILPMYSIDACGSKRVVEF
jgi:hypothetical protein